MPQHKSNIVHISIAPLGLSWERGLGEPATPPPPRYATPSGLSVLLQSGSLLWIPRSSSPVCQLPLVQYVHSESDHLSTQNFDAALGSLPTYWYNDQKAGKGLFFLRDYSQLYCVEVSLITVPAPGLLGYTQAPLTLKAQASP